MSKQTTEELVKRLLNAEPGARQEAARVIEAMGRECAVWREQPKGKCDPNVPHIADCPRCGSAMDIAARRRSARAATDEVIDLKTQEDGR